MDGEALPREYRGVNRTLSLAAALAACALLAGCPAKDACNLPTQKCGDRCLDVSADPQNCGACGNVCGAGQGCCHGACIDPSALQTDVANCGSCGNRCAVNGTCTAGICGCGDPAFPDGCGGTCVNLANGNGGSCGQCGWTCAGTDVSAADAPCTAGACVCAGTPQATDCGNGGSGQCVNTLKDERNCGACGATNPALHVCKPRAICTAGTCGCTDPAFQNECTGGCVNFNTDAANCGSCGHACTGATPTCSAGICCPTGQTSCSGACVDTRTSSSNCGACGTVCPGQQTCEAGACGCRGATPRSCGSLCCAGTACCAGGTSCQTAHSNGLNATPFYDCNSAPYSSTNPWTAAAAASAAESWHVGTSVPVSCNGSCTGRQTTTSCAVWCYAGTYAGKVTSMTLTNDCTTVCNNFFGSQSVTTWQ